MSVFFLPIYNTVTTSIIGLAFWTVSLLLLKQKIFEPKVEKEEEEEEEKTKMRTGCYLYISNAAITLTAFFI